MTDKLSDEIRAYPYSAFEDNQREKWADRAAALEQQVEGLEETLREAYPFVESAGYADNSGEEYIPRCQECEPLLGAHTADCPLNAWLERNKALAAAEPPPLPDPPEPSSVF